MSTPVPVATRPKPMSANPVLRIARDLVSELRTRRGNFPPGPLNFDLGRARRFTHDPLPILLPLYEEHGPIFCARIFHNLEVFMLGPEANHFITVGHPENFHWREGHFADLTPLIGDGLLTIDEAYHDRARRIMMPAFHARQIEASLEAMVIEAEAGLRDWRPGEVIDVYDWMRNLAMRIAMRALLGLDPDDDGHGASAAHHFERALAYYGTEPQVRILQLPRTPWARMKASRKVLDEIVYGEIAERRERPDPERLDVLSLLIEARDEDGTGFTAEEVRDQLMTLMFAGHDTTTSTFSFLLYELSRHPEALARVCEEQDRVLGGAAPSMEQLIGELPYLDMVLDETLRLYPPAWIGPRRAVREFEFGGYTVPAGTYVSYSSWASHRIPEVFGDPEAFIPERFTRERKAALPRGAYIPFGGGTRVCIGKRFGQMEVKLVSTMALQRFRLESQPGRTMTIRQMPTLSPDGGLRMVVRERTSG